MLAHLEWAKSGARKYAGIAKGLFDFEDFLSAAYEGLVIAARKFKPELGWKFKTYAMNWTEQKMIRLMMEHKRQTGWAYHHSRADRMAGKKGMERRAHIEQFPVGEDGHELEIASHAYREDFIDALDVEQKKMLVMALTRTPRERYVMEKLLTGANYTEIGVSLGISWQRVHQIAKPMLKRIQSEIQQ